MKQILTGTIFLSVVSLLGMWSCKENKIVRPDEFRGNPISQIPADGVIRLSGSPYLVIDTLQVDSGKTLTIEPGVELRFEEALPLIVRGGIRAEGTPEAPIIFTSGKKYPRRGDWDGIWLIGAQEAVFKYAKFFFGAKYGRHYRYRVIRPGVVDSTVVDYGSITAIASDPHIERCWFVAGGFHGVHCDSLSRPIITHSVFYDNAGHGIYVRWDAQPEIRYNIITENDDYGVFCAEPGERRRSDLTIFYNIIWSNFSGEFNLQAPFGLGRVSRVNANLDSCDHQFNLRLNPDYRDASRWDFRLNSCSAAIDAGPEGADLEEDGTRADLGIFHYLYQPGEIRRRIPNLPVVGDRLTARGRPYLVTCDLIIPPDVTLTIDPGVEVQVMGRYAIRVKGNLVVRGESSAPVRFISGSPQPRPGDWLGIFFEAGGQSVGEISYAEIRHSRFALHLTARDTHLDHLTIGQVDSVGIFSQNESQTTIGESEVSGAAIAGVLARGNSRLTIARSRIHSGGGYGIFADNASLLDVTNTIIDHWGVTGVRLENLSGGRFINNVIALNGYYGILCLNNSLPEVRNTIIYRNGAVERGGVGILAERSSFPIVKYNLFWDHPNGHIKISGALSEPDNTNLTNFDPLFINPSQGDFRLQEKSPAKDKGDPELLDRDGSRSDIGAYGGPNAP